MILATWRINEEANKAGEARSGAEMSRSGGRPPILAEDAPWRAPPPGQKPFPRIHVSPILRVSQNPSSAYAFAVMKVVLFKLRFFGFFSILF